ncbi:hypothetical protein FDJ25_gp139 [Vibrio phage Aphrodite1]|uniref:Uncharacterized protein n=3 Tax=Aphroditevirus TaxID=2560092 RepID=A0A2I7QI41_9CAUD|nr:hypothetical protein FDJ25_gp139 [Vibrio phage Aphrodite1]YP_009847787.1 hypothetical protein HWC35_gp051 [Vibrio phage USC-1]AUR81059.1 hypothetical protein Aphrodite1_0062 [Vibrio phage Aphrodite1]QCW23283.1 hypothetical protein [Vibrio phage 5 TSL-2019]QDH47445.1 hypothetical protein [Vibrio phage USC-1]
MSNKNQNKNAGKNEAEYVDDFEKYEGPKTEETKGSDKDQGTSEASKKETPVNEGKQGINLYSLVGGLIAGGAVSAYTRSTTAAITTAGAVGGASYYLGKQDRERSMVKDVAIGAAVGVVSATAGSMLGSLFDNPDAEELETIPTQQD